MAGSDIVRFDVHLVKLDPAKGSEIRKTRPCLIISPNEMNCRIRTVIVAPMTSTRKKYPTRVSCQFRGVDGEIVLDQIRTVDKSRLVKRLGRVSRQTQQATLNKLQEVFAS